MYYQTCCLAIQFVLYSAYDILTSTSAYGFLWENLVYPKCNFSETITVLLATQFVLYSAYDMLPSTGAYGFL